MPQSLDAYKEKILYGRADFISSRPSGRFIPIYWPLNQHRLIARVVPMLSYKWTVGRWPISLLWTGSPDCDKNNWTTILTVDYPALEPFVAKSYLIPSTYPVLESKFSCLGLKFSIRNKRDGPDLDWMCINHIQMWEYLWPFFLFPARVSIKHALSSAHGNVLDVELEDAQHIDVQVKSIGVSR